MVARPRAAAVSRVRARAHGRGGSPLPALYERHHRTAQRHHAHHRWLSHTGGVDAQVRLRPPARHRRLLVLGRRRLGHRALVHRLRPARESCDERALRGNAGLPGERSALADHREVQGHDPLHGADGDPHVHEVGIRVSRIARPVVVAVARQRGRAHQPRSVGVVLASHRRRALPRRRHVVADRDRRHHDQPAPRCHHAEARQRDVPAPRHRRRHRRRRRRIGEDPRWRLSRAHAPVAGDAARHLGRPRALPRHVLELASATGTSPATAPSATTTATTGCSAASTT